MKLNNSINSYSREEAHLLNLKMQTFIETLQDTDAHMNKELVALSDPEEGDNVIHLDMRPFTEFHRLEQVSMPFHEIVETYTNWNETLWMLAKANTGHYKHKKLVLYLVKFRHMIATIMNFFDEKGNLREPTKAPNPPPVEGGTCPPDDGGTCG